MEGDLGLITNLSFQLGGVGIGHIHIAGLHGLHDLLGLLPYRLLNLTDEIHQFHGVRTTDVIHTERHVVGTVCCHWRFVQTLDGTVGNVVDIGEIANHVAIVEYLYRLTLTDGTGKEHRSHVGTSPWSVDREVTESGGRNAIQLTVAMGHQLVGFLAGSIQTDRIVHLVILRERGLGVQPIDRTGGGEKEMLDRIVATALDDVQETCQVTGKIGIGIRDGIANTRLSSQVDDFIKLFLSEKRIQRLLVLDAHPHKP